MPSQLVAVLRIPQTATTRSDYHLPFADSTQNWTTECSIDDCSGEYEARTVIHTVRLVGQAVVIDNVPAEVCESCGDVLFTPETLRRIEDLLANLPKPNQTVPLFEYA